MLGHHQTLGFPVKAEQHFHFAVGNHQSQDNPSSWLPQLTTPRTEMEKWIHIARMCHTYIQIITAWTAAAAKFSPKIRKKDFCCSCWVWEPNRLFWRYQLKPSLRLSNNLDKSSFKFLLGGVQGTTMRSPVTWESLIANALTIQPLVGINETILTKAQRKIYHGAGEATRHSAHRWNQPTYCACCCLWLRHSGCVMEMGDT